MDCSGSAYSSEASWVAGDSLHIPVNSKEQYLSYNWKISTVTVICIADNGHFYIELRPDLFE